MATRRSKEEIEKDRQKVKEAAEIAATMEEVAAITNLSYFEIRTSLQEQPGAFEAIKKQVKDNAKSYTNLKIRTLIVANKVDGKLTISEFEDKFKSVLVCSEGIEYTRGTRELKINDDIYIAIKKLRGVVFSHYKMISLEDENNSKLIFSTKISAREDIKNISNPNYKSFLENVINNF